MPEEVPELVNTQLKGESALHYKEEIGNKVKHVYTIHNNGSWRASNLRVEIEWPIQAANRREQGKWLLYIDEAPVVEGYFRLQCDLSWYSCMKSACLWIRDVFHF